MAFERLIPGTVEWELYFANHIFRYRFALDQLKLHDKKKVLDAACGVGYGSKFLLENGMKPVVGVDINVEALKIANKDFSHADLVFIEDDCHTLDRAKQYGTFDSIVSFETLEHLPKPLSFLRQCFSMLEQNGLLILSTPNALVTSPDGKTTWAYHEKEYTPEEFLGLLREAGFSNVTLYGQGYTATGIFRQQVRGELNKINSNPFMRMGRWLQRTLKGRWFGATMPEQLEDFEIVPEKSFLSNQPFVLLATAVK